MNYDKDFIVSIPTQEISRLVQEKFFCDGIAWVGGRYCFDSDPVEAYGEITCIRYRSIDRAFSFGHTTFYRNVHPSIVIISIEDFLQFNNRQAMMLEPRYEHSC